MNTREARCLLAGVGVGVGLLLVPATLEAQNPQQGPPVRV